MIPLSQNHRDMAPLSGHIVVQRRTPLRRTHQALGRGGLTVGFLGGSITEDNTGNWPDPAMAWLYEKFPSTCLVVENAGIGATGSDSACLRVDREILGRGCDLCFVEYAVNDQEVCTERRMRTREGLIRKLRTAGLDVVIVYTYSQAMYADMSNGRVPPGIAEFEKLAHHYALSSVWAGLHAIREVASGNMKWHQWLPDALHPSPRGSWSYAQAIRMLWETELCSPLPRPVENRIEMPPPMDPMNWENIAFVPLSSVTLEGPWLLKRLHSTKHVDQALETHAPGSKLGFSFAGRGLALVFEYGRLSSDLRYRVDGGEWTTVEWARPDWAGDRGRVDPLVISDELPMGTHQFEMEVVNGNRPDCLGTECRLCLIGAIL